MKIAFHTFGCKLNQVETEAAAEMFAEAGFDICTDDSADLFFVNTCAVTGKAEGKSRRYLHKLAENNPGRVIAAGCLAQAKPYEIAALADFRMVLGTKEKADAVALLSDNSGLNVFVSDSPQGHFSPFSGNRYRSRTFVKIQDGCDHNCSYCIVPKLRGSSVSLQADEVISRVKEAVIPQSHEVVLTGVDIGSYRSNGMNLTSLLKVLCEIPGLVRIRLSSLEPPGVNDELINFCASNHKICPHFHLPLQSGSNKILQRMNRNYTREEYIALCNSISDKIPDVRLGADVLVGFPGETEQDFMDTVQLVEKTALSHLHIFPFSPRPGTDFGEKDDIISPQVKNHRFNYLKKIIAAKNAEFIDNQLGSVREVFFEADGSGFTDNYIRVIAQNSKPHGFANVKLANYDSSLRAVLGIII